MGISWIQGSELNTRGDTMKFLTSTILLLASNTQASDPAVVHAVPVVSLPAPATAGYAVGASGAVGGQAPVVATSVLPATTYTTTLPATVAHHTALDIATHAIPVEHHAVPIHPIAIGPHHPHGFSYGFTTHHLGKRSAHHLGYLGYHGYHGLPIGLKSAPCVNVHNIPVPCNLGHGLYYGHGLHYGLH